MPAPGSPPASLISRSAWARTAGCPPTCWLPASSPSIQVSTASTSEFSTTRNCSRIWCSDDCRTWFRVNHATPARTTAARIHAAARCAFGLPGASWPPLPRPGNSRVGTELHVRSARRHGRLHQRFRPVIPQQGFHFAAQRSGFLRRLGRETRPVRLRGPPAREGRSPECSIWDQVRAWSRLSSRRSQARMKVQSCSTFRLEQPSSSATSCDVQAPEKTKLNNVCFFGVFGGQI